MAARGRPRDREPRHPAQAPLDVPVQQREREAPSRYVPRVHTCRPPKVAMPKTYEEAMASPEACQWKAACAEELNSLRTNGTYVCEPCPPGVKPLPCRWVFDVKTDGAGKIERFKARLVAEGNGGTSGVEYWETVAQATSHATRRLFFAIAAEEDWEVDHVDVDTIFLSGTLEEQVYMLQPPGFHTGDPNVVWRLVKSLKGLKQASQGWYWELEKVLREHGLAPCYSDPSLFKRESEGQSPVFVQVLVHDMLIGGKDLAGVVETKAMLRQRFSGHDLGPVRCFLDKVVERDRKARTIKLTAAPKIEELLVKFDQANAQSAPTPMTKEFMQTAHLVKSGEDGSWELLPQGHRYAELVGSLQHLQGIARPDIARAVEELSRYKAQPATAHWDAGMRVLRYLKGTKHLGPVFGKSTHAPVGYVDVGYAGDLGTRRSTTGYVLLMNGGPVSWCSKKQRSAASSPVDAEYLALSEATSEIRWLATLLEAFGLPKCKFSLNGGNSGCLGNLKNSSIASGPSAKHIGVAFHSAREWVTRGLIALSHVNEDANVARIFTKHLSDHMFAHRAGMGM